MFFALYGYVLAYNHLDGRELNVRRSVLFAPLACSRVLHGRDAEVAFSVCRDAASCVPVCRFRQGHSVSARHTLRISPAWFSHSSSNGRSWSLSCEVFFYLPFPVFPISIDATFASMAHHRLLWNCRFESRITVALSDPASRWRPIFLDTRKDPLLRAETGFSCATAITRTHTNNNQCCRCMRYIAAMPSAEK
jgi:hypothetical protein